MYKPSFLWYNVLVTNKNVLLLLFYHYIITFIYLLQTAFRGKCKSKQAKQVIKEKRKGECTMAKNWKFGEAVREIMAGNKEAILDIGRRYPLFLNLASQVNEAGALLIDCVPDYCTARKIESVLKGEVTEKAEVEETEEEEETPKKKPAKKAPAKKAKKAEPEEEDEDEEDWDEEEDDEEEEEETPKKPSKKPAKKAAKPSKKPAKKSKKSEPEDDDDDDDDDWDV